MNIGMLENLQVALEYKRWDNFHKVIKQTMISCKNSNVDISGQFLEVEKLSINVKSDKRRIIDYKLSRYACYLITQNSNSNINANDQFVQVDKLIQHGKGGMKNIKDYELSRYACYLIAQNVNSHMKVIALI